VAAIIIDGKKIAEEVRERIFRQVQAFIARYGRPPGLAVVQVGEDPASRVYVRNKRAMSAKLGIASLAHDLPEQTSEDDLLKLIGRLNANPAVDSILVQMPLPRHMNPDKVMETIDPAKDADGLHPCNLGRLFAGMPGVKPCTPAGIMEMLRTTDTPIKGKTAAVVGRSNLVGKPIAMLLLQAHATVTICHSRTPDLAAECRRADILVAAVGQPRLIQAGWIKPGAVVIDVGTSRTADGKLAGDVDFEPSCEVAGWISPVPGGVGPMTIAMLMQNTINAAYAREERHG